jgi:cytidylate kinase
MAIVTISRGTLSGGSVLADCLSRRLGYRSIDLSSLLRKAATARVSEYDLRAALEQPPDFPGTSNHRRYIYHVLLQAALLHEIRGGRAIYHGLAGHLLLRGVPSLIRLRVIAPLEFRIRRAAEELHLGRKEAAAHIAETDRDRRQWTQFLYGVDWSDPSQYDLVVNLERLSLDHACDMVVALVEGGGFVLKPDDEATLNDLAIAAGIQKALTLSPLTLHLEVQVESRGGKVVVQVSSADEDEEAIRRVAATVPGVREIRVERQATA